MAPDSIRMAIRDCLENLSKDDLEKFCHQLIHRGGEPRVRRNKVDGKSILQITDTLVNTFLETGALEVTLEVLRKIGCSDDANDLVKDTESLASSTSSRSAAEASGGAASRPANATKKHFIDKHRNTLISRVTNLDTILDELLDREVINSAVYNEIKAKATSEAKMRGILDGPMKGGTKCKDILYEILVRFERFLVEELNEQNE